MMQSCSKCGEEKTLEDFELRKDTGKYRTTCKSCTSESQHKRYLAHREEVIEANRVWRVENPEKYKLQNKNLYEARDKESEKTRLRELARKPEQRVKQNIRRKEWRKQPHVKVKEAAYSRQYATDNPELFRESARRRRARIAEAEGSFSEQEFKYMIRSYGNRCLCCGELSLSLHADHVIPLSKGGTNRIDNIQPLCKSCNSSKGTKTIDYRKLEELNYG